MRPALATLAALELLTGRRPPDLIDHPRGIAVDLGDRTPVVLGPKSQAGLPGELTVVGHDVGLGVVVQPAGVEVGRADRQPAVVDDRHLGVDIDPRGPTAADGRDRARGETTGPTVG